MVFSSVVFIFLFLPLTLAAYYLISHNLRNSVLLISSLIFYFWGEGKYVYVMIFYMFFNYVAGVVIEGFRGKRSDLLATAALVVSLIVNIGILIYFKYIAFIVTNLNKIGEVFQTTINVPETHLPIGISFFSFQAISYIVDVFRRDVAAQQNIVNFSMYKAFFPQLIAGPIVRYRDVATQILDRNHSVEKFTDGFKRFTIGLGKKVLIANNVAAVADNMFKMTQQDLSSAYAWLGIVCYSFQIYFDFSGYSDMAIGLAKMFGFDFLENFNYPYISKSIKEFWRRWHISLSSWFRDYVYISLGGNRVGKYRCLLNLLAVFLLCGLWHGANWTFVAWGAWHGLFLVFERTSVGKRVEKLPRLIGIVYTNIVVLFGWVLFRSDSMHHAYHIFKALFFIQPVSPLLIPSLDLSVIYAVLFGIVASTPLAPEIKSLLLSTTNRTLKLFGSFLDISWAFLVFIVSMAYLANSTYNPFIYFRF